MASVAAKETQSGEGAKSGSCFRILTRALALTTIAAVSAGTATAGPCTAPADLVQLGAPLPKLLATVRAHEPVTVVALGSSSTWGAGASSRAHTYPAKLESELRIAWPGAAVKVVNAGINGELARDMVARIDRHVTRHKPQLVIWQTGVNDAIKGVPLDDYRRQLIAGIEKLRATGADVVLIDQQYYPRFKMLKDGPNYMTVMRETAAQAGVPVVQRFRIMQHLLASAQFTTETMLAADLFHLNDRSYDCIGHLLAQSLRGATTMATKSVTLPGNAAMPVTNSAATAMPVAATAAGAAGKKPAGVSALTKSATAPVDTGKLTGADKGGKL